jgi:hypothetical protein
MSGAKQWLTRVHGWSGATLCRAHDCSRSTLYGEPPPATPAARSPPRWSGPGAATLIFVIGIFLAVAPALPHDCTWARSLMALCGSAPLVRYLAGGWARTARRAGGRTRGADQGQGPCEPSRRAAAGSEEEGGMTQDCPGSRRRPHAGRADPDALPASGRPKANRRPGRERDRADHEAAA